MSASSSVNSLDLHPADDMHLHLRDGDVLLSTAPAAAKQFRRAIIMPNLQPPVTKTQQAVEYRQRILDAIKQHFPNNTPEFTPLMTLYLTDNTTPQDIIEAKASGAVFACKLYPAGATTHSSQGVTDITKLYPVFEQMIKSHILLLVHGEVTDQSIDVFDREAVFIERYLRDIVQKFPGLKVVMEHITTKQAVEFVTSCSANVGATITCQHLLYNRNALFQGGLNPHRYCLPVLKGEEHREAVLRAATSGSPKFFAGTDSAPHPKGNKEASCCAAGCYTVYAAIELYAEAFDSVNALDKLDNFLSKTGAEFYGLERNSGSTRQLQRKQWTVPVSLPLGTKTEVVPLKTDLRWSLSERS